MSLDTLAAEFLAQERLAIVGVSRTDGTGKSIYTAFRDRGFHVVPVNPHAAEIDGAPCYPDLQSVPGGVDAAIIVTRPDVTEQVVDDCIAAGVTHVWMHYNPMFGAGNSSVSETAVANCRAHGIKVIDGACPMMYGDRADFGHKCMRWMLGVAGKLPEVA